MTPKQIRFINEYLIDSNATQAAIRAGYSKKTAYSIGQENLKKPEIKRKIYEEFEALHNIHRSMLIIAGEEAIRALSEIVKSGKGVARVQAANSILDRSGHKAMSMVQSNINSCVTTNVSFKDSRREFLEEFNKMFPSQRLNMSSNSK